MLTITVGFRGLDQFLSWIEVLVRKWLTESSDVKFITGSGCLVDISPFFDKYEELQYTVAVCLKRNGQH